MTDENLDALYTEKNLLEDALLDNSTPRKMDVIKRMDIIKQIRNNDFDTDVNSFKEGLDAACSAIHGEYLVPRSLKSLQNMKTFKVKGINAGFALSKMKGADGHCEIVALYNSSEYWRLGMHLLFSAQENGGKYLECFGEHLSDKLYVAYGFEDYKIIENVKMRDGKIENLHFMKLKWECKPKE